MSLSRPIVITGTAGRIGARLAAELLAAGQAIIGLDPASPRISHRHYRHVQAAADDRTAITAALAGAETLIHLGAFMSWLPADAQKLRHANIEGTAILLEAAAKAGIGRLVFASSGEVYPEGAPEFLPLDETHPTRPRSVYGLTKLIGEEMVHYHARTAGMAATILRFSHTQDAVELLDETSFFSGPRFFLGPRIRQQEAFGNAAALAVLRAAAPEGSPALLLARNENGRPFRMMITETRDMVAGIHLALGSARAIGETFNLGATEPFDFGERLPQMAEAAGLPLVAVDLPGAGVFYETSNRKIRETLGFVPQWTIDRMIAEAAAARKTNRAS